MSSLSVLAGEYKQMHITTVKFLTLTIVVGLIVAAQPVHAGFQWVPPEAVGGQIVVAPLAAAPAGAPPTIIQAPSVISPVIVQGTPTVAPVQPVPLVPTVTAPMPLQPVPLQAAPLQPTPLQPASPVATVGGVAAMPVPLAPQSDMVVSVSPVPVSANPSPLPQPLPMVSAAAAPVVGRPPAEVPATDAVVMGFANQVPLAIALKQILPQGTKFSAEADVSMDTAVSFKGGRPWRETLTESLKAVGLAMVEVDRVVRIRRAPLGLGVVASEKSAQLSEVLHAEPAVLPLPAASRGEHMNDVSVPSVLPTLAASVPAVEVVPSSAKVEWKAERGDSLRKVLSDWSKRGGAELQWLAEYDYPLFASVNFNGTFEQAVRAILEGFSGANPQPIARLHANPTVGQMVLVVRVRGNSDSN